MYLKIDFVDLFVDLIVDLIVEFVVVVDLIVDFVIFHLEKKNYQMEFDILKHLLSF